MQIWIQLDESETWDCVSKEILGHAYADAVSQEKMLLTNYT